MDRSLVHCIVILIRLKISVTGRKMGHNNNWKRQCKTQSREPSEFPYLIPNRRVSRRTLSETLFSCQPLTFNRVLQNFSKTDIIYYGFYGFLMNPVILPDQLMGTEKTSIFFNKFCNFFFEQLFQYMWNGFSLLN